MTSLPLKGKSLEHLCKGHFMIIFLAIVIWSWDDVFFLHIKKEEAKSHSTSFGRMCG
jgi:hypothetical protein